MFFSDLCYDSDPGESSFRMTVSETGAYTIMKEEEYMKEGYDVKRSKSINIGGVAVVKGVGANRMVSSTRRRRPYFDALCDVSDDNDDDDRVSTEGLHHKQDVLQRLPGEVSFDESDDEFSDLCDGLAEIGREQHFDVSKGNKDINKHSDVLSKVQVSLNDSMT